MKLAAPKLHRRKVVDAQNKVSDTLPLFVIYVKHTVHESGYQA